MDENVNRKSLLVLLSRKLWKSGRNNQYANFYLQYSHIQIPLCASYFERRWGQGGSWALSPGYAWTNANLYQLRICYGHNHVLNSNVLSKINYHFNLVKLNLLQDQNNHWTMPVLLATTCFLLMDEMSTKGCDRKMLFTRTSVLLNTFWKYILFLYPYWLWINKQINGCGSWFTEKQVS